MNKNKKNILSAVLIILSFLTVNIAKIIDLQLNETPLLTTLAIFIFGLILWITAIMPASLTGLIIIILFTLYNVLSFEEAVAGLGNKVVWLVIAFLIFSQAIKVYKLDLHIAYFLLSFSKGSKKGTLLIMISIAFLLTFIIPNSVGRLSILLTIGEGIIDKNKETRFTNFSKAMMLTITYAPYIGTIATVTGAAGTIYAVGLFSEMIDYEWTYLYWLALMAPGVALSLLILWIIVLIVYPMKNDKLLISADYYKHEKQQLGKLPINAKKFVLLFTALLVSWITEPIHGISVALSAVTFMTILFFPRINILKWEDSIKRVDWGIPLLFASGLSIAAAFEESGLILIISDLAINHLGNHNLISFSLIITSSIILIRLLFTNFNAMVASILPVILIISVNLNINPLWSGMLALSIMSLSYIFPTQSVGNLLMLSYSYYSPKDLAKCGILLTIAMAALFMGLAFFYWPVLNLHP